MTAAADFQTATKTNGHQTLFEAGTCPRCLGSGRYGPVCVMGGRCFTCGGGGVKLTKRGAAAQAFFNNLRRVPATAFAVGDRFYSEGFSAGSYSEPSRWIEVREVIIAADGSRTLIGVDVRRGTPFTYGNLTAENLLRKAQTAEQRQAAVAQAIAYQATLTKAGKPAKRAAVAA